eukprot:5440819-Pleurochrysis_carterae.AAC.1
MAFTGSCNTNDLRSGSGTGAGAGARLGSGSKKGAHWAAAAIASKEYPRTWGAEREAALRKYAVCDASPKQKNYACECQIEVKDTRDNSCK